MEDFFSSLQRKELNTIVNQKEIRVFGLRRSGNHAIINWIEKQVPDICVHMNNLRANENPFRGYLNAFEENVHQIDKWRAGELQRYPLYQGEAGLQRLKNEVRGNFNYKGCLILSYEDYSFSLVANDFFEKKHDLYLGKSASRFDILVLRDPFNLLASRLRSNKMKFKSKTAKSFAQLWIEYAKEYLGETNYLQHNRVTINFNKWFLERDYRESIATKLELDFSDHAFNTVPAFGQGSSFDGREFNGNAREMDLLNRWRAFSEHPEYLELSSNEEICSYSQSIFGNIPGEELTCSLKTSLNKNREIQ